MSTSERSQSLTHLARLGFSHLAQAEAELTELEALLQVGREALTEPASRAADPDAAVAAVTHIARRDAASVRALYSDAAAWRALWVLLGASTGFADFYLRHPEELVHLRGPGSSLPTPDELRAATGCASLEDAFVRAIGSDEGLFA